MNPRYQQFPRRPAKGKTEQLAQMKRKVRRMMAPDRNTKPVAQANMPRGTAKTQWQERPAPLAPMQSVRQAR